MGYSFYRTSYSKGSVVLYVFNFGAQAFIISSLVMDESRRGLMKNFQASNTRVIVDASSNPPVSNVKLL